MAQIVNAKAIQLTIVEKEQHVVNEEEMVKQILDEIITKIEHIAARDNVKLKLSVCTNVGWWGVFVIFFMLVISLLFLYCYYIYGGFRQPDRGFIWLFMTMSVLYSLVSFYYIICYYALMRFLSIIGYYILLI